MTAEEKLDATGFDNVLIFDSRTYDNALIGVTVDGRAVYDYDEMVCGLMTDEDWTADEAVEWIEFNVVRALPYAGEMAPIIMHRFLED